MSSSEPEEPERPESASGAGVHDFDAVELDYEAEEEDLEAADAATASNKGDDDEGEDEEKRWLAAVAADIDEVCSNRFNPLRYLYFHSEIGFFFQPCAVGDETSKGEEEDIEVEEEELEEGELSDDEGGDARKERLKPQPVCRFYSKGQCTWGNSCRFMHPGVLDKGNYSMFSEPKPILPGAEQIIEMEQESFFFVM